VYKDKGKQKEANKAAAQRRRDKTKGMTPAVTPKPNVIPNSHTQNVIPNYGQPGCECMHCKHNRANGSRHILNHGPHKPAHLLGQDELNRVSLPGDPDYDGTAQHLLEAQAQERS